MKMCTLDFVDKKCEICANIKYFNREAVASPESRARKLLRETTYWLYDESTDYFGPSKFVGFKSMTFECYNDWVKKAKKTKDEAGFFGAVGLKEIECLLGGKLIKYKFAAFFERNGL